MCVASVGVMYVLLKWYLDVVAEDGAVFIGYAARLRWAGLRLGYASFLLAPAAGPVRETATIRRVSPPLRSGRSISWSSDALDVRGRWRAAGPSIRETLLSSREGSIDWTCVAPSARARVRVGERCIVGMGYVEFLRMTIPPGRLLFDELRWGRFITPRHALVWIAWDGGHPLRRAWLDGRARHDVAVSGNGLHWPGGQPDLPFADRRILRERRVRDTLAGLVPSLTRRLAGLAGMRETKWLSRATLRDGTEEPQDGWAIHEVVTWAGPSLS